MSAGRIFLRVVVAPDSYKGSVSALGVAQAMERGILKVFPNAQVCKIPLADGGEGTVEALVAATGGQLQQAEVTGPLGKRVMASWGILGDGITAVIEMAAASGLPLVSANERNPRLTTSYGTGELIGAALEAGLRKIIVGIGGSASNDGGAGMARALGVRFSNAAGEDLPEGGAALAALAQIDMRGIDPRLQEAEITVACDIDNPLCGPRGAAAVFGPAKGATPEIVAELDRALRHYSVVLERATGRNVAEVSGAGLLAFADAKLKPGVEIILAAAGFAGLVKDASFVITGEGRTDFQTAFGKAPVGVARAAKRYGVPVFCLSGSLGEGADEILAQGIDAVMTNCDRPMTLDESMIAGSALIESGAARLCRIIRAARLNR